MPDLLLKSRAICAQVDSIGVKNAIHSLTSLNLFQAGNYPTLCFREKRLTCRSSLSGCYALELFDGKTNKMDLVNLAQEFTNKTPCTILSASYTDRSETLHAIYHSQRTELWLRHRPPSTWRYLYIEDTCTDCNRFSQAY